MTPQRRNFGRPNETLDVQTELWKTSHAVGSTILLFLPLRAAAFIVDSFFRGHLRGLRRLVAMTPSDSIFPVTPAVDDSKTYFYPYLVVWFAIIREILQFNHY
jgi:hypothetical protein